MTMINLGSKIPPYPMPVALVGAMVEGKANFMAVAWFTMATYRPPSMAIVLGNYHCTNDGIRENRNFSVCLPSREHAQVTDYCGLTSGKKVDKSQLFDVFFGELGTAPMISDFPVNVECRLSQIVESGPNEIFIGEIVGLYGDEEYIVDRELDMERIDPLILSQANSAYFALGEKVADAWSIGKEFKPQRGQ